MIPFLVVLGAAMPVEVGYFLTGIPPFFHGSGICNLLLYSIDVIIKVIEMAE